MVANVFGLCGGYMKKVLYLLSVFILNTIFALLYGGGIFYLMAKYSKFDNGTITFGIGFVCIFIGIFFSQTGSPFNSIVVRRGRDTSNDFIEKLENMGESTKGLPMLNVEKVWLRVLYKRNWIEIIFYAVIAFAFTVYNFREYFIT